MRPKYEGGAVALWEFAQRTNFLKPNGQSRTLNVHGLAVCNTPSALGSVAI